MWAAVINLAAKAYLHYKVSSDLDDAIVMVSPYADIQYRGVSSTMSGELSIDGISPRIGTFNDEIYIDKLSIITPSFLHLIELGDIGYNIGTGGMDFPDLLGFAVSGRRSRRTTSSRYTKRARPSEPIALSQIDLYKPSDVPALLNLSASTE